MQHGSHPPREPLHFPDAPQAHFRIGVEQVATSSVTRMLESPRAAGDACRKSQIDRDKTNWCGPQSWVRATEPDGSREGLLQFAHSAWTDALGRRVVWRFGFLSISCPLTPGIRLYGVEVVEAGDSTDSRKRQEIKGLLLTR